MPDIKIDARNADKIQGLLSGRKVTINVKTKLSYTIIEMEDVNFHFDSAVLLPDYGKEAPQPGTKEQNRITGLGVIYACYKQSQNKSFAQRILVAGHTDKKGSGDYNLKLSRLRAENVFFALTGKKTEWATVSDKKHQVEDYQQILKWISYNWGWDCDPGEVNNEKNSETDEALRKFQVRYNDEYESHIPETGNIEIKTWGAFFDVYMDELSIIMGITREGLGDIQSKLQFVEKPAPSPSPRVGCGENFPASKSKTETENPVDRRVEILFFDDGEEPLLKCHPDSAACISSKCDLYGTKDLYQRNPVPAEPLPVPSGEAARVFLQLFYKDPESNKKSFPQDLPVTIEFPDGTSQDETTSKDGKLKFLVEREKKSFTLKFDTSNEIYFSFSKDSDETKSVFEPEVKDLFSKGNKIFKLPLKWSVKNSKWEVNNTEDFNNPDFINIEEKKKNIGSEGGFVEMILDPNWQFVRLEFFDRVCGHSDHENLRICIPPVLLEGFRTAPSSENDKPDTKAGWIINEDKLKDTSLCLPWIIRKSDSGTDEPKPDNKILLKFKTDQNTFVVTEDAATRKLEKVDDKEKLNPGPDRLKYYDLPEQWNSKKYFTRFKDQDGKLFESLTQSDFDKSLNKDTPLIFSLDDIILTDKDLKQHKISSQERITLFYHQFLNPNTGVGKPISDQGIYNPGTDASKDVYPYSDITLIDGSLITDYPDWTRMVITEGNIFEISDKRTNGSGTDVLGARAAVMWVDVVKIGVKPEQTMNKRPDRFDSNTDSKKSSFSIQPFFSQDIYVTRGKDLTQGTYKEWEKPVSTFDGFLIGRFDKVLLRNCDLKDGYELAKSLSFFRFFYNLTGAPSKNKDGTPFNANDYEKKMLENLPKRWNGPDGGNPGTVEIKPQDESKLKIKIQPYFFVQKSIFNRAHFQINIISIPRANMNGGIGEGNFSTGNEAPDSTNSFIAAHECGHGASLPDEYNERWTTDACSYQFLGFGCNTPGDPFSMVPHSSTHAPLMYEGTTNVHSRYYWHSAEFVSKITGIPFNVEITRGTTTRKYNVKSHPNSPHRNFNHFPLFIESNATVGTHSLFDLYLYQLGDDEYRYEFLSGSGCDGLLLVLIKIRFSIPEAKKHGDIVHTLASFRNEVAKNLSYTFTYKGDLSDVHFDNLLVHFTPRFLVENLIIDLTDPHNIDYLNGLGYTFTPPLPGPPTATNATQADYISHVNNVENFHPRHFMVKIGKNLTTGWSGSNELHIKLDVTKSGNNLGSIMWRYFGDMAGLNLSAGSKTPTSDDVKNIIVKRAVPGVK